MAKLQVFYPIDGIAINLGADKTMLLIQAPANQRVAISGLRIGLVGQVTTDQPLRVRIFKATAAGTVVAGSANVLATPGATDTSLTETPQSQYLAAPPTGAWGTEPTYVSKAAGGVLYSNRVHPQGNLPEEFPFARPIIIGGGKMIGLVIYGGAANAIDGGLYGEE